MFQPQGFGRFRETLKHEDHIHNQIEACRQAFNRGDNTEIRYAVESLLLLITPHMIDEKPPLFLEQVRFLNDEWKETKRKAELEYRKRIRLAQGGCPDLIDKPNVQPNAEHFKKLFMVACALFERKNLMLKIEKEDEI